jgi:type II secretory pathway component PulF
LKDVKSSSSASHPKEVIQAITYGEETGRLDIQADEEH